MFSFPLPPLPQRRYFNKQAYDKELVSKQGFDAALAGAADELADRPDDAGISDGPESVTFRTFRESFAFLAGGRAALLQLAHPFVAAALVAHSSLKSDVHHRFLRTFQLVFKIMFGTRSQAFAAARTVHRLHAQVHGVVGEDVGGFTAASRYAANHEDALLWVFSTLMESSVLTWELIKGPLPRRDKDQLLKGAQRGMRLFGLQPHRVPGSWDTFMEYNHAMWRDVDVLAVGHAAKTMEKHLFTPPTRCAWLGLKWAKLNTAVLLPRRVAQDFGLSVGVVGHVVFCVLMGAVKVVWMFLPRSSRVLTGSLEAEARMSGRPYCRPLASLSAWLAKTFVHLTLAPRKTMSVSAALTQPASSS